MQQKIMLLQKRSYLCPWLLESALGSVIPHMSILQLRYPQTLADIPHFTREGLERSKIPLEIVAHGFL